MHDVAAGKTAIRERTKPHGLSIVRGGRGVAGRTVGLLGAIFTYAIHKGIRTDNPVHCVVKLVEGRRHRRLTDDQYRQLGKALAKAEAGMMGTDHVMMEPNHVSETSERDEVIPLAEEQVEVGKRRVDHATRIRRYVVETPVERQVTLRDETVEIERRRPVEGTSPGAGAFEERTVEVHTSSEQPEVTKTVNIAEEVVVRKTVTERPETIRETVRKEQVEVNQDDRTAAQRG